MKLISILYQNRVPEAPDTPTFQKLIKDLGTTLDAFNGIVIPAEVPAEIKAKIADGIKKVADSKSYQDRIRAIGSYPRNMTPDETDTLLKSEVSAWTEIAKAGVRLD